MNPMGTMGAGVGGNSGDILDDAMSRGVGGAGGRYGDEMYRDRSKNLLSDAGSRFGDDDVMSHFMGQSEYGGASQVGDHQIGGYSGVGAGH